MQSVIDSGKEFNVIYAENDDMASGRCCGSGQGKHLHGVGRDVIVMGFDCNKWALERTVSPATELRRPVQPPSRLPIDAIIKDLENGKAPAEKTIVMDEKGFDASTITQEDVDNYGI